MPKRPPEAKAFVKALLEWKRWRILNHIPPEEAEKKRPKPEDFDKPANG